VMAMVFLGERPQLFHFVGFALVLIGVYVASRKASAPAAAQVTEP
jgi:drug/metabolite transporter (DMT)-like permease